MSASFTHKGIVTPRQLLIAFCLTLSGFLSPLLAQTIRYVTPTGTGNGSSWANASADLQAMINSSATNDQVWVAVGEYKPGGTGNTNRSSSFSMKNGVVIYGGFLGSETALSQRRNPQTQFIRSVLSGEIGNLTTTADNSYHVLKNQRGTNTSAILDGFVITAGKADGTGFDDDGAGLFNEGSDAGNSCSPTIKNCSFEFNEAVSRGGAVFNHGDSGSSSPQFTNCSFIGNAAESGGAIYTFGFLGVSQPRLVSCLFQGNSARTGAGGAIYNLANDCRITNCSFVSNTAPIGGVLYDGNGNDGIRSVFTNCSFLLNKASRYAGVVYSYGSGPTNATLFTNCAFYDNGGANVFYNPYTSRVIADYCLFDSNMAGYGYTATNSQTVSTSPFSSTTSTRLSLCSSAINAGLNTASGLSGITTDLDGNARTSYGRVDIGAYEAQSIPVLPVSLTPTPAYTLTTGMSVTLTATGASSYTWSTGNRSATLIATPTSTTVYSVTGATGVCSGIASIPITVVCGAITYVTQSGAGQRNGTSWSNAYPGTSLQAAIDQAASCGGTAQVWVAAGTYKPTTTTSRTISLAMRNNVTIYGGLLGTETDVTQRPVISLLTNQPSSSTLSGDIGTLNNTADNSLHVIRNPRGTTSSAILDGFVISNGNANGGGNDVLGGGMYNDGTDVGNQCSPTVRNCLFQSNMASSGGAVFNDGRLGSSYPQFYNCVFRNNSATNDGGGMFSNGLFGVCNPTLINCAFLSNTSTGISGSGGACSSYSGDGQCNSQFVNCLFQANSAVSNGGAITLSGGTSLTSTSSAMLTNCTFQNNSCSLGGAIANIGFRGTARVTLTNCIAFGNGGRSTFYNFNASVIATNSLFEPSSVTVTGVSVSGPGNLTTTTSPFVSASNATLLSCSPAINAGSNSAYSSLTVSSSLDADLAGNARVVGAQIDLGAYESTNTQRTIVSVKNGSWTDGSTWSCGLVPLAIDKVSIQHSVTMPSTYMGNGSAIQYGTVGRLLLGTGARLRLGL